MFEFPPARTEPKTTTNSPAGFSLAGVIFISGHGVSTILGYRVKSKWARGSRERGFSMQALRCRALTAGESVSAVRRERKRSVNLQKPPKASFQGCQEFIGLISVGGAATEESTAAAAAEQTPGKTMAIAADASTSTDFPLWAERNRKIVIPPPQAPAERQTSGHL